MLPFGMSEEPENEISEWDFPVVSVYRLREGCSREAVQAALKSFEGIIYVGKHSAKMVIPVSLHATAKIGDEDVNVTICGKRWLADFRMHSNGLTALFYDEVGEALWEALFNSSELKSLLNEVCYVKHIVIDEVKVIEQVVLSKLPKITSRKAREIKNGVCLLLDPFVFNYLAKILTTADVVGCLKGKVDDYSFFVEMLNNRYFYVEKVDDKSPYIFGSRSQRDALIVADVMDCMNMAIFMSILRFMPNKLDNIYVEKLDEGFMLEIYGRVEENTDLITAYHVSKLIDPVFEISEQFISTALKNLEKYRHLLICGVEYPAKRMCKYLLESLYENLSKLPLFCQTCGKATLLTYCYNDSDITVRAVCPKCKKTISKNDISMLPFAASVP